MTIEQARNAVREMDPDLSEDDEGFAVAEMLLYAVENGTHDIRRLAGATGRGRERVAEWVIRLRESNVFQGTPNEPRFAVLDWFDEEGGGMAFWLDVSVALGWLQKVPA